MSLVFYVACPVVAIIERVNGNQSKWLPATQIVHDDVVLTSPQLGSR